MEATQMPSKGKWTKCSNVCTIKYHLALKRKLIKKSTNLINPDITITISNNIQYLQFRESKIIAKVKATGKNNYLPRSKVFLKSKVF